MRNQKRLVLVASVGHSPQVLTGMVWELAHLPTPVVPDEIVVLADGRSARKLKATVLNGAQSVWRRLLDDLVADGVRIEGRLLLGSTRIRVFPDTQGDEAEDLRTAEDNLRAADFILQQLRQYTESSDVELIVSIAGGRKTTSALLLSCMTLLGRENDRVYHLLQSPEYEGREESPMYGANELFEVPYVRMRGWYLEKFKDIPPSYCTLVTKVQSVSPKAVVYPKIGLDVAAGTMKLDGRLVHLSKTNFAALYLIAKGCPIKDLHARLVGLHNSRSARRCDWLDTFREGSRFADIEAVEDLSKTLSELRKKLKSAGFPSAEALVPQRGNPVLFPLERISYGKGEEGLDICGCPMPTQAKGDVV